MELEKGNFVYIFCHMMEGAHYSYIDAFTINEYLGENFDKRDEHVFIVNDGFILIEEYFNMLLQNIESKKNKYNITFIFTEDLYQFICNNNISLKNLVDRLETLRKKGICLPSIHFMYSIGTKEYVRYDSLKKLMLDGTLVYPYDMDKIRHLENGDYYIKHGLSSSGKGNYTLHGNGKYLTKILDTKKEIIKHITNGEIDKVKEIRRSLENEYKLEPEIIGMLFDNRDICSDYAIIQRFTDLFEKCYEWKFFVLKDKIIGLANNNRVSDITIELKKNEESTLNKNIFSFVKKVIDIINEIFSAEYFFARIDITITCYNDDNKKSDDIFNDYIFGNRNDFKIYLNEIEPLGCGLKDKAICLYEKDDNVKITTGIKSCIYGIIGDEIARIAGLSRKNNMMVDELNTKISNDKNFYRKYKKYKNKYLNLKRIYQI